MKLKIYTILSLVLVMMAFSSCLDASSLMDKEDVGDLYEKDVFKDPTYARYFVNDIYYSLPKGLRFLVHGTVPILIVLQTMEKLVIWNRMPKDLMMAIGMLKVCR